MRIYLYAAAKPFASRSEDGSPTIRPLEMWNKPGLSRVEHGVFLLNRWSLSPDTPHGAASVIAAAPTVLSHVFSEPPHAVVHGFDVVLGSSYQGVILGDTEFGTETFPIEAAVAWAGVPHDILSPGSVSGPQGPRLIPYSDAPEPAPRAWYTPHRIPPRKLIFIVKLWSFVHDGLQYSILAGAAATVYERLSASPFEMVEGRRAVIGTLVEDLFFDIDGEMQGAFDTASILAWADIPFELVDSASTDTAYGGIGPTLGKPTE